MDDLWCSWFVGLVDGEGCFFMGYRADDHAFPMLQFKLGLRSDDRPLLEEIYSKMKMGGLYDNPSQRVCQWIVLKKADILALVDFFGRFPLRSKKSRDFKIWAKAAKLWTSRDWRGRATPSLTSDREKMRSEMKKLHDELRAVRNSTI